MRVLLLFCLGILLPLPALAQERVRNVRMRVADSSQLEIRYDLVNVRPGDSVYLEVKSRLRGSLRILPEFVRGDIGKRIVAGTDRRIVWNALANGYSLNEEVRATVLVKSGPPITVLSTRTPETATKPTIDRPAADAVVEKPKQPEPVTVQPAPADTRPAPTAAPTPSTSAPVAAQPRANEPKAQQSSTQPAVAQPTTSQPAAQPSAAQPGVAQPGVAQSNVTRTKPTDTPLSRSSTPTPDTVASRKKRYAGPAWALLSAVVPGAGNIFVQTPKPRIGFRPLLAVGCYGLLYYGLQERQKSRDVYAIYEQQKNAETGDPYYNTANDHYHRYFLATRGAIVVAAADVILTFFKGMRNVQAAKKSTLQSVTLRPGLQVGQPTAVVRYSF